MAHLPRLQLEASSEKGATLRVIPGRGWSGGRCPLKPPFLLIREGDESAAQCLGEDPGHGGRAGRVAPESGGPRADALQPGAPGPGPDLDDTPGQSNVMSVSLQRGSAVGSGSVSKPSPQGCNTACDVVTISVLTLHTKGCWRSSSVGMLAEFRRTWFRRFGASCRTWRPRYSRGTWTCRATACTH